MEEQYLILKKIADHNGTEKTPTHALYCKDGKSGSDYQVAKFYTREGNYGKFLSGVMSNDYTNKDGKFFPGFRINKNKTVGDEIKPKEEITPKGLSESDIW